MKDKLKNIFENIFKSLKTKLSYVMEFGCALVFSIMLFNLIIKSYYSHSIVVGYAIFSLIFAVMLIMIIGYNLKKDKDKIENLFLIFSIPLCLLFMVFVIPGQVPDEMAHMIKAYEVSEGKLFTPKDENGETLTTVPCSLLNYEYSKISTYNEFLEEIKKETNYSDTMQFVSSAQGNSFILYIFPSIAFFLGRAFNIHIIYAIYLGRIINILIFILIGYISIKKIPFGKLLLAIYMLVPIMFQQNASFSADVIVNSVSIYFIVNLLSLLVREEDIDKKECIKYCVLSAILGVAKIVYAPIIGIGLLLLQNKNINKKKKILLIAISIGVGAFCAIASYAVSLGYSSATESLSEYNALNNINTSEQIKSILKNPTLAITALCNDWKNNTFEYIKMCIGSKLGWLDIFPNEGMIVLYLIIILATIAYENNAYQLNKVQKGWIITIGVGMILLIQLSMYIGCTPIGSTWGVGGVQGRYFIPVYILFLLCLCSKENYLKNKYANIILFTTSFVINISAIYTICKFFII